MFENCTKQKDKSKIFSVKEEGKVYTLNNKKRFLIAKIMVDKCLFDETIKKCDWLFLVEEKKAIFVELKGSSIKHGLQQLEESYNRLKSDLGNRIIWFRLSIGEKNSVPRSVRDEKSYKFLFGISKDNLRIGKQISDTLN